MRWLSFALVLAGIAAGCATGSSGVTPPGSSSGDADAGTSGGATSGTPTTGKPITTNGDDDDDGGASSGDSGTTRPAGTIRIMAANLSTGNKQSYDDGVGARIFQGLKPDIAMIQELNYGDKTDSAIRTFVTNTFGASYNVYRESGTGLTIPNGIVTRFPILSSGRQADAPDRGFVYAKIAVPGAHPLWAFSIHLLTSSTTNRNNEAVALVALVKSLVAPGDLVALAGDFNTDSRSEACLTTLQEIVDAANSHASDGTNEDTNAPRNKPYDWVFGSPALVAEQVPTVIGANSFPNGLVFDSRVYTPLSDVAPILATDSAALNMQHMGVIKDFNLQ